MGQEISQLFTSKLDDQLCQNLLSGLKGFEKKTMTKKQLICCIDFFKAQQHSKIKSSPPPLPPLVPVVQRLSHQFAKTFESVLVGVFDKWRLRSVNLSGELSE